MAHTIAEVKGMGAAAQATLAAAEIRTVEQLIERTRSASERIALAKQLGVSSAELTKWINRADLMRIKGVGTEMANLLEECGVDSCKELQHRVPANLQAKLKATNDEKKITHHAPTLAQVEEWIREAATLTTSS